MEKKQILADGAISSRDFGKGDPRGIRTRLFHAGGPRKNRKKWVIMFFGFCWLGFRSITKVGLKNYSC